MYVLQCSWFELAPVKCVLMKNQEFRLLDVFLAWKWTFLALLQRSVGFWFCSRLTPRLQRHRATSWGGDGCSCSPGERPPPRAVRLGGQRDWPMDAPRVGRQPDSGPAPIGGGLCDHPWAPPAFTLASGTEPDEEVRGQRCPFRPAPSSPPPSRQGDAARPPPAPHPSGPAEQVL